MVCYSSHVLNIKLIVRYSNGEKLFNQTFYHGRHLITEQAEVCYSDKLAIQMYSTQIPTVFSTVYSIYMDK